MTEINTTEVVDMTAAIALLDELKEMAVKLDRAPLHPLDDSNRAKMRAAADRSRELLYAAHLADGVRFEILSQYHAYKGQQPPMLNV